MASAPPRRAANWSATPVRRTVAAAMASKSGAVPAEATTRPSSLLKQDRAEVAHARDLFEQRGKVAAFAGAADPRQVERQAFAFHQRRQHLLDGGFQRAVVSQRVALLPVLQDRGLLFGHAPQPGAFA